ncbi:unnamed protein product [Calicophoron daubneyi]|uniref:HECT-type E3 ubiquitin transferase E3D n=1 Tax=Calicophoron daubneyi TaxID=300641 RepID=A0AAV2TTZ1_CALDB
MGNYPYPERSYFSDTMLSVLPEEIKVQTALGTYLISLSGLRISCVTCTNLENFEDSLSCCFNASFPKLPPISQKVTGILEQLLVNGNALLCKFCQSTLIEIRDIKSFKYQPPIFSLDVGNSCSDETYFCHPQDGVHSKDGTSVHLSKLDVTPNSVSSSSCLHTGVEVVIVPSLMEKESFQQKSGGCLFCSHCFMAVGQTVTVGPQNYYALWTNCLNVLTEEKDIDGDFLRFVDKPLLEEAAFYGLFIASLLENHCYRVILSAVTWDGSFDFMLLWLIDQELQLYSAALPKIPIPADQSDDERTTTDSMKTENSKDAELLPTTSLVLEPTTCRRVFYKLLLPSNNEPHKEGPDLLQSWRKDFGVSLFSLPWETCIGLASCLLQFTARMTPRSRKPDQHLLGFTCGAVPVANTSL